DAERYHLFLPQHEGVEGITVLAKRLRQEPVVGGIVHGAVQNPVHAQEPGLLVQLVFHLRALGDLDDHGEMVRDALPEGDVVPRVRSHRTPSEGDPTWPRLREALTTTSIAMPHRDGLSLTRSRGGGRVVV